MLLKAVCLFVCSNISISSIWFDGFLLTLCMQPLHYKAHILFVCVCLFAFFISNSFPNKFLFSFHPKSPNMNFNCVIFFVCKFGSSVCVLETPDYLDNWRRLQDIRTVWISTWQHRFVTMSTFHSRKMSRSHCSSLSQFIKVWMRNYFTGLWTRGRNWPVQYHTRIFCQISQIESRIPWSNLKKAL